MRQAKAEGMVWLSAIVVAGIFAYRKFIETGTISSKTGSTASFVTGFMVVYTTLSGLAIAAPPIGGGLAALVMIGDLLTQGQGLVNDLNTTLKRHVVAGTTAPAATAAAPASTGAPLMPEQPGKTH